MTPGLCARSRSQPPPADRSPSTLPARRSSRATPRPARQYGRRRMCHTSRRRRSGVPSSAERSDRPNRFGHRFYYGTIGRNGKEIGDPNVAAGAGRWLSYTVVLKNHSAATFQFGATCPSYSESVDNDYVAYVLNCHPVGSIAPGSRSGSRCGSVCRGINAVSGSRSSTGRFRRIPTTHRARARRLFATDTRTSGSHAAV